MDESVNMTDVLKDVKKSSGDAKKTFAFAKIDTKNWTPTYTRILAYTDKGVGVSEISRIVGKSRNFIYYLREQPLFKAKLEALHNKTTLPTPDYIKEDAKRISKIDKAKGILEDAAEYAADKLRALARKGTNKEAIQLAACKEILDRTNIKGKETIVTETRFYTPEEVDSANKTLLEMEAVTARVTTTENRFVLPQRDKSHSLSPNEKAQDGEESISPDGSTGPDSVSA